MTFGLFSAPLSFQQVRLYPICLFFAPFTSCPSKMASRGDHLQRRRTEQWPWSKWRSFLQAAMLLKERRSPQEQKQHWKRSRINSSGLPLLKTHHLTISSNAVGRCFSWTPICSRRMRCPYRHRKRSVRDITPEHLRPLLNDVQDTARCWRFSEDLRASVLEEIVNVVRLDVSQPEAFEQ